MAAVHILYFYNSENQVNPDSGQVPTNGINKEGNGLAITKHNFIKKNSTKLAECMNA